MFTRGFEKLHPRVQFCFFAFVVGVTMFCRHPVLLGVSLVGSAALAADRGRPRRPRWWIPVLFLGFGLLNFLFVHRGATVLFFLGDNPMTLESLWYGLDSGVMVVTTLLWFESLSRFLSGDRLLCVFGGIAPGLALTVSMVLRFVPMFGRRLGEIRRAQTAVGLYKEDSLPDTIRGEARVFSVLLTGALEKGIVTAESMEARAYGTGRRTFYTPLSMRREDRIFLSGILLLGGGTVAALMGGGFSLEWYPELCLRALSPWGSAVTVAFGAVTLCPSLLQWRRKWRKRREHR